VQLNLIGQSTATRCTLRLNVSQVNNANDYCHVITVRTKTGRMSLHAADDRPMSDCCRLKLKAQIFRFVRFLDSTEI
jgi:hypothetical protein